MNKRTPWTRGVLGNPIGHEQEESLGIRRDLEQKTFLCCEGEVKDREYMRASRRTGVV